MDARNWVTLGWVLAGFAQATEPVGALEPLVHTRESSGWFGNAKWTTPQVVSLEAGWLFADMEHVQGTAVRRWSGPCLSVEPGIHGIKAHAGLGVVSAHVEANSSRATLTWLHVWRDSSGSPAGTDWAGIELFQSVGQVVALSAGLLFSTADGDALFTCGIGVGF